MKGIVSYCHHFTSVVRLLLVKVLIFIFRNTHRIETKLGWNVQHSWLSVVIMVPINDQIWLLGTNKAFLLDGISNIFFLRNAWTIDTKYVFLCLRDTCMFCVCWLTKMAITIEGPSWSWSYSSCLSPLMLWVLIPLMARCTQYNIMW